MLLTLIPQLKATSGFVYYYCMWGSVNPGGLMPITALVVPENSIWAMTFPAISLNYFHCVSAILKGSMKVYEEKKPCHLLQNGPN